VDVFVFTDNPKLKKAIESASKSKNFRISIFPVDSIKKSVKSGGNPILAYIDCTGLDPDLTNHVKFLSKKENVLVGIIDQKKSAYDVAELFFLGAVDYIGAMDLSEYFTETRFRSVLKYVKNFRKDSEVTHKSTVPHDRREHDHKIARAGWDEIEPGKEYTFQIMFIELDGEKDLEKKYTKKHVHEALSVFTSYINRYITNFQGKIWIWKDLGGIVLFPFNGKECKSVTAGFVIYIYKFLHDVEESHFPNFISFRMAIHLGNVIYAKKETGNIISDTINTVFHIGKKFAEPGRFYITSEVMNYIPPELNQYFLPAGEFEGKSLYRMKKPHFTR
jgi:hypothetical protein